ncbi:MAG: hypothetical protein A3E00_12920 [Curvibacter sp. RIFCSPHIGHO2_12_FULL_63_18]|nr:MAG: hypothetical protein A2037_11115 [Curvibacter sp. GWA2_63_95]OGP01131.1 MAG: hypothetical protein A3E00_12920 [Curvibacter sp. RIFCSPHIGHO2_12_FULL_63_18]
MLYSMAHDFTFTIAPAMQLDQFHIILEIQTLHGAAAKQRSQHGLEIKARTIAEHQRTMWCNGSPLLH